MYALVSTPSRVSKRKRRVSVRTFSRTASSAGTSKRKAEQIEGLVLNSFSSIFQKLTKGNAAPSPIRDLETVTEDEYESSLKYLHSESVHLDQHTTQVSSLSTPQQVKIKEMMVDPGEMPLSLFRISYCKNHEMEVKCILVVSTIRVYFTEDANMDKASEIIDLLDIAVVCLHLKAATAVLYLCCPDPSYLLITSGQLVDLIKALQFLSYQTHLTFIPMSSFSSYREMIEYADNLNLSDINLLHSMEALKTQEVILVSGGDLEERKLVLQPCTYKSEGGLFLLTNRKVYVLSKEYKSLQSKKLSEIRSTEKDGNLIRLIGRDWKLELGMQDCLRAINLARSS